jgi:hypothetical protein
MKLCIRGLEKRQTITNRSRDLRIQTQLSAVEEDVTLLLFECVIENHSGVVALGYFALNFIDIHRTPRFTPQWGRCRHGSAAGSV